MRYAIIAVIIVIPLALLGTLGWSLAAGTSERAIGPSLRVVQLTAGDQTRGAELYKSKCVGCHTADAKIGPSHASPEFKIRYADDESLMAAVRGGRAPMPAFSKDILSDQQLADIVVYVRTLQ